MGSLDGKVALVTGAVRRPFIGKATILRLAALGASVVCADKLPNADEPEVEGDTTVVPAEQLHALVDELRAGGHRAIGIDLDAGRRESVDRALHAAVAEFGRVDICCHLGGGTAPSRDLPLMQIDEDAWNVTLERNLTSVWLLNRAVAAQMIEQGGGGAIVNLGSFAAVRLGSGPPAFSAVKAGAEALTKLFAKELAPYGIRVNIVHPLGVDAGEGTRNPGLARAAEQAGRTVDQWMRDMIPFGRFQTADETAAVIAFLCSPESSFTSGQAVSVAGAALP